MKKKSQIELFMPINEDIAGQHRTNKDVNNADDPEGTLGKSFTDDDFSEDNLKKEALGLFDIPAGAPDGAQNFRGRDSYKEEDFETSNKTGFGGESVIDIDEDEHPINIQRRDEFNSANNDENRKKDFFSFLGFKSTGISMNKELEKLASVLSKSGYSDISDKITKFSSEEYDELMEKALMQATNLITWAAAHSESNSGSAEGIKNHIEAEEHEKAIGSKLIELLIKFINDAEPDFDDDELPAAKSLLRQMLSGSRSAQDTANQINKIYYANNLDNETRDVINDASVFANSARRLIKLRDKKENSKKEKENSKKEKEEKEALTKDEQDKRNQAKQEALARAKIVESWYDTTLGKTLGRDDFGRIQEEDETSPTGFRFIDGYPGAEWKVAHDKENRLWRASAKYRVIQYEKIPESGKFENYPFRGPKSASIGVDTKMIKKAISKRDNIIKHASKLNQNELNYFNSKPRKSSEDINSQVVLRAMHGGSAAVEALWQKALPQMRAIEVAYTKANESFWNSVKYDPGVFTKGAVTGLYLPADIRKKLSDRWSFWKTRNQGGFSPKRIEKAVREALDAKGISRASMNFDIDQSNFTFLKEMGLQHSEWRMNMKYYLDAYWAVKIMGGSTNRNFVDGRDIPNYPPLKKGKDGLPVYPLGPIETKARGKDGTLIATDSAGFKDENGDSKYGYEKDFYWVCTVKGAKNCSKWALLGTYQPSNVGWGFDKDRNKSILMKKVSGTWHIWNGNSWQRMGKKASLSNRDKRLVKSGMKKDSIRSKRLRKVSQIVPPTEGVKTDGTNNSNKTNKRRGTGGGGTCGVTIQANLNKSLFHQGRATQAQQLLLDYQPIGKADGNWGPCSHSGWLLFLDALGDLGAKSPEYKSRIPAYVSGLRRRKVTSGVVQDAVDAWKALGGGRTGAAASVAPASFKDMQAQMGKEEEGKVFTDDLLIKYLLSDSLYEKTKLRNNPQVQTLIRERGKKILKAKIENVNNEKTTQPGTSIYARLPQKLKREFLNLFGLKTDQGIEGTEPQAISFDWKFLKYNSGRGNYILTDIISDHRDLIITSLKEEVCRLKDTTGPCQERQLRDLKAESKPETNIPLMSAISAAGVEAERAGRKEDAKIQANIASIASSMFSMPNVVNDSLISLMDSNTTYIATNGARITHDSDMADMVSDNQKAGKIEAVINDIIIAAADKLKSKIFADRGLLAGIAAILKENTGDGQEGIILQKIDKEIAKVHQDKSNWRDGYIFEQIISNKSMLKETDSWGGWDLGIGVDSRQDIIKKYREQATNPLNKRVKKRSS